MEHIDVLRALRDSKIDDYFYPSDAQRAALDSAINVLSAKVVAWGLFKVIDGTLYSFCATENDAKSYRHVVENSRDDITLGISPLYAAYDLADELNKVAP